MRQVRRKTMDTAARDYFLKAKHEGLQLSWNKYEAMLPQDGFSQLGLSCHECLQGPCRLNPFRPEEDSAVCGLGKDELALGWLTRQAGENRELVISGSQMLVELRLYGSTGEVTLDLLKSKADKWSVSGDGVVDILTGLCVKFSELAYPQPQCKTCEMSYLKSLGSQQIKLVDFNTDLAELLYGNCESQSRLVGLAVLKEKAVNICLDGTNASLQASALQLIVELEEEAIKRGAIEGVNIVLAGDFSTNFAFNTSCNEGTIEFAILTGLVDLYLIGDSLGRGRIPAKGYHTVVASAVSTKEALREVFLQGIAAYAQRDLAKVKVSNDLEKAESVGGIDSQRIKELLDQGMVKGICVIGGGSNLRLTEDQASLDIVKMLGLRKILCLTYGNSAVTLAKYGALKAPLVYSVGGESDAGVILEILRVVGSEKAVAVFPELTSARDLQMALAISEIGVKAFTGVQLPVGGSAKISEAISKIIEYRGPKELAETVVKCYED
ncbi:MAG TPA: hypothetical protein VFC58_02825 [Desulfosporosinus sp.]|nr:hypothetical protein [Desulfosporosinus sp.]